MSKYGDYIQYRSARTCGRCSTDHQSETNAHVRPAVHTILVRPFATAVTSVSGCRFCIWQNMLVQTDKCAPLL